MHPQELLEHYRQGERNFAYVDLSGADLSGLNLRGANFTGANFTEANLSWAFLNQANLTEACLRRADLHNATLNNANLGQAMLSGANLSKVDLRLAQLTEADLNWAILTDADLSTANLEFAKLDQINLERAKLNSANLGHAELMEANLRRTNLAGANLAQANLREAHLEEANLREAVLVGANLSEASLIGAYLRQANLTAADLHRSVLTGADLSEAILDQADLSRANLAGAYLLKASLHKAHLLRANLQDVFLLRANLSEANLRGADLERADLSGAYFHQAVLSEANLSGAYLLETVLNHTTLEGAQMTGCCIANWRTEALDLSKVNCRYVFTQFDPVAKKPCDRLPQSRDFEPGEFAKSVQNDQVAVELYFTECPNWEALVFTLAQVEAEEPEALTLTIQGYELLQDNYVVQLTTNRGVNAKHITRRVFQHYPTIKQRWLSQRATVLALLGIQSGTTDPPPAIAPDEPVTVIQTEPSPSLEQRTRLYQEVVRQIQHILVTQAPAQIIENVERLLNYLHHEGISTVEIQRKLIGQAIAQRAQRDRGFRTYLVDWAKTAPPSALQSTVGQAIQLAVSFLQKK